MMFVKEHFVRHFAQCSTIIQKEKTAKISNDKATTIPLVIKSNPIRPRVGPLCHTLK